MYTSSTVDSADLEDLLIKSGISMLTGNDKGRTPFFYCFIKDKFMGKGSAGDCDPIELATKMMNNPKVDLNGRDLSRNTPLHFACKCGSTLCVITMVKAGAKLDAQNAKKNTPVGSAFMHNKVGLCVYLLQEVSPSQKVYPHKTSPQPPVKPLYLIRSRPYYPRRSSTSG